MKYMDEPPPASPHASTDVDGDLPLAAILLKDPTRAGMRPGSAAAAAIDNVAVSPDTPFTPGRTYVVPKRFGISAILAMITALAFLFGFLRLLEVPPVAFLFFGTMVLVISIVQMFCGRVPRLASIVAGAVLSPLFIGASLWSFGESGHLAEVICVMWGSVFWGAIGGYLTGTCAAGIFLVMEKIDPYLPGGHSRAARAKTAAAHRLGEQP